MNYVVLLNELNFVQTANTPTNITIKLNRVHMYEDAVAAAPCVVFNV